MPRRDDYLWKVDRWDGGWSEDSRIGLYPGAFRYGQGLDYRSDSGLLGIANKPTVDDGGQVDQLIKWLEYDFGNSEMYGYGGADIYLEDGGTYSDDRVLSGDSPAGQGMGIFNGSLYVVKDTVLSRRVLSTDTWTESYQTGLTSAPFHPVARFKNNVLIGHGRYVATIDDTTTYTAQALTLPPDYYARSIFRAGSYAIILATHGENITDSEEGYMFLWNGVSDVYNDFVPITGNPHAGIALNNKIVIIAGNPPRIMESYGGAFAIMQELPDVGVGKTAEVYPGAIETWRGMVHFGISAGDSTILRGVWTWGSRKQGQPDTLNFEYPISTGTTGSDAQITALKKVGNTLRFAWKDDTDYGVDEVDTTSLQTSATYRSLVFDNFSPYEKTPSKLIVEFAGALTSGDSVAAKLSTDPYDDATFSDSSSYLSKTENTVGATKLELPFGSQDTQLRGNDLHLELVLSGNVKVKRTWIDIDEDTESI